jgi:hypothetical protein
MNTIIYMTDEVAAYREANKILLFLAKKLREKKITELEMQLVLEEGNEVYRHAGYLNERDRHSMDPGDEYSGIETQANHLKRLKFAEMHPELEQELIQYIETRTLVPRATFVARATGSVQLFEEYEKILDFIEAKRRTMEIKRETAYEIFDKIASCAEDNGIYSDQINVNTDVNLLNALIKMIKDSLLKIDTDLLDQLTKSLRNNIKI